jgi:hypothetical protein
MLEFRRRGLHFLMAFMGLYFEGCTVRLHGLRSSILVIDPQDHFGWNVNGANFGHESEERERFNFVADFNVGSFEFALTEDFSAVLVEDLLFPVRFVDEELEP